MVKTTTALVGFVAVLCFTAAAGANQRRIAVLQPDEELLRGVSLALAPWGIETTSSNAPLPKSSQPEAVRVAAQLARRLEVEALVWITRIEQGSLLWVFDVRTGEVTTRLISETPPFDGAAAAAVALSVKTVLRATVVAPPAERFGLQPPPPTTDSVSAPRDSVSAVEVGAGSHWIGTSRRDLRVRLAGVLWFWAAPRLGLALVVSSGLGLRIDHPDYSGRYREFVAGARARFRIVDLSGFSTIIGLGGAAHWAKLQGTLTADSHPGNVDRLNGSFDIEASFNFDVTEALYLGASIGAAYSPSYRRYLVGGEPIFAPWPVTPNLTGFCGVEF
jgi:hypothetical protein